VLFKAYKVKSDHRKPSLIAKKSQWTISEWEELILFAVAKFRGWNVSQKSGKHELWSIYIQDDKRSKIGEDSSGDLFIAKYITDTNNEWHGYPVSPKLYDIPPEYILNLWLQEGLIDKADKKKIMGGKF
jgi:hypothetical protein